MAHLWPPGPCILWPWATRYKCSLSLRLLTRGCWNTLVVCKHNLVQGPLALARQRASALRGLLVLGVLEHLNTPCSGYPLYV